MKLLVAATVLLVALAAALAADAPAPGTVRGNYRYNPRFSCISHRRRMIICTQSPTNHARSSPGSLQTDSSEPQNFSRFFAQYSKKTLIIMIFY